MYSSPEVILHDGLPRICKTEKSVTMNSIYIYMNLVEVC